MRTFLALALSGFVALTAACGSADASSADGPADEAMAPGADAAMPAPSTATSEQELPTVLVYKSPTCGCCNGWVQHLEAAGFTVDARDVADIMSVKVDAGVPSQLSSCHTAIVDGYVVEGHVPADQLKRLIAEKPEVAGIAVPGMPTGSPGMEGPNPQPYRVYSFTRDGRAAVFAEVDPR